jgi:hypothetical protein
MNRTIRQSVCLLLLGCVIGCNERSHDGTAPIFPGAGPEFAMRPVAAGFAAEHAAQGLSVRFTDAAHIRHISGVDLQASFVELGRADRRVRLEDCGGPLLLDSHTVVYDRGRLREWWRSGAPGLELGATIAERPGDSGRVEILLRLRGAQAHGTGRTLRLLSPTGVTLAMGSLYVKDATGRPLSAAMEARGDAVLFTYEDTDAIYPVVVDPIVYVEEQQVIAPDGLRRHQLGTSIAMSLDGSRMVVGAIGTGSNLTGSAYVFRRDAEGWVMEQRLDGSEVHLGSQFGLSVAMNADGSLILIGAPLDQMFNLTNAGLAYAFARTDTTWTEEQILMASDAMSGDYFGDSVAMSADGTRAIVGARWADTAGSNAGSAYVFVRGAQWEEEQRLLAPDRESDDIFGTSVSIDTDGTRVIVGALLANTGPNGTDAGAAYVFLRNGVSWSFEQKLTAADGGTSDWLGRADSLDGTATRALVSGDGTDVDSGPAYVFVRDGTSWTEEAKLIASDRQHGDRGGFSVSLDPAGERALFGAHLHDALGSDSGTAYLFVRSGTTWSQEQKLLASNGGPMDEFGKAVAISGDGMTAAVGVPVGDIGDVDDQGSVYLFGGQFTDGSVGSICTLDNHCNDGHCVDGHCCDDPCGGTDPGDCQACAIDTGATADGTCTILDATYVCRPAAGPCDVDETCATGMSACPADTFLPNTEVCRPASGGCDLEETCTGTLPGCPEDIFVTSGTECLASTGACDPAETCTGTSPTCPNDTLDPSGTECRPSTGDCDPAEACDGSTVDCPPDLLAASTVVCREAVGNCDVEELCTGSEPGCPDDLFAASTLVCREAVSDCDVEELCTGSDPDCPTDEVAGDGTSCDDGAACNGTETCTAGACTAGAQMCDDNDPCTIDSCAEPGTCSFDPIPDCEPDDPGEEEGCSCSATSSSERREGRALMWLLVAGLLMWRKR